MFEKIYLELKQLLGNQFAMRVNHNLLFPEDHFEEYPQHMTIKFNHYHIELFMSHANLNERERHLIASLVKKSLEMMQTSGKQLLLDEEGYTRYQTALEFPLKLWHISFKNNFDDVFAILKSTFANDEIVMMNHNEMIVFVTDFGHSPYELIGMIETEALTSAKIVIGDRCTHIGEIHKSYQQIIDLQKVGGQIKINEQVLRFDQMIMPYLLWKLKSTGQHDVIESVFKNQVKKLGDEELEQTAINFFNNNLNVTETANKLYIHRNTLIYRLNKIETATGYDIRKFTDALNFYIHYLVGKLL